MLNTFFGYNPLGSVNSFIKIMRHILTKLVTQKNNLINHVLDVNSDVECIASKFSFDVKSDYKRWHHLMWQRFANILVHQGSVVP